MLYPNLQFAADAPLLDRLSDKKGSFSSCLEMLLLTVKLTWPLTLVVSKRQLLHYQVSKSCRFCALGIEGTLQAVNPFTCSSRQQQQIASAWPTTQQRSCLPADNLPSQALPSFRTADNVCLLLF